jgi:membrane-bound metal-dependent hydrolase YbcI (DUF457 family)
MFIGHAALAFGVVALLAMALGVSRKRAGVLAVTAGLFAVVPDVDMVYALVGLVGVDPTNPLSAAESFWGASTVVHRAVTHSLVVAVPAAGAFALAPTYRRVASAGFVGVVAVGWIASGPLAAVILALFAAAGWLVAVASYDAGLRARSLFAVALFGLASHPFGDMFTGEPPRLFYPLDAVLFESRVTLSADPTLHLLGAFGVELAAIWLAVFAALTLTDRRLSAHVNPRATFGVGYATAALVLQPPTLDVSYHFVFSVVAVGAVGVVPVPTRQSIPLPTRESLSLPAPSTAIITGLAAVTLAGLAYAIAYSTSLA